MKPRCITSSSGVTWRLAVGLVVRLDFGVLANDIKRCWQSSSQFVAAIGLLKSSLESLIGIKMEFDILGVNLNDVSLNEDEVRNGNAQDPGKTLEKQCFCII